MAHGDLRPASIGCVYGKGFVRRGRVRLVVESVAVADHLFLCERVCHVSNVVQEHALGVVTWRAVPYVVRAVLGRAKLGAESAAVEHNAVRREDGVERLAGHTAYGGAMQWA